nr:BspA family leucine-rich repeat surface protein [Olsenella intestinalis]
MWGTCAWNISSDGTLRVRAGTGADIVDEHGAPWHLSNRQIVRAIFDDGVVFPKKCRSLFQAKYYVESIDLSKVDFSQVQDAGRMFQDCTKLTSVNMSGWDTSSLRVADWMFSGCKSLPQIDVSKWDTRKLSSAINVFNTCESLTSVDLSGWDVSNVTTVSVGLNQPLIVGLNQPIRVKHNQPDPSIEGRPSNLPASPMLVLHHAGVRRTDEWIASSMAYRRL